MRIAHVSDCYLPRLGGIERQVHDLAARQQAAGHHVEVITSVGGEPDQGPVLVHRLGPPGPPGKINYCASWRGAAIVRDGGFDVVHLHMSTWSPLAFRTARAATGRALPVAAAVHSMWDYATPLFRASACAAGWRHWPIAWSAVSAAAARPLVGILRGAPVSIIPNGLDADRWALPEPVRDPRRVVIASVMRLAARKRPRLLLRMLADLRRLVPAHIRIEARVIGAGPQRARLEADVDRLGIGEWVTLTGELEGTEIHDLYRDTDIYIAPATLESFGIAALEARAAGLPVIAHARTGVADFIQHGVHGLLAPSDDAMLAALHRLVVEPELRAAIATHNRTHRPAITWSQVLDQCDALYARAIAQSGRQAAGNASVGVGR